MPVTRTKQKTGLMGAFSPASPAAHLLGCSVGNDWISITGDELRNTVQSRAAFANDGEKKKRYVYKNKSDFPHGRFLQLPADFTGGSSKSFPCGVEPLGCRIRLAGDGESPWRVKEKVSRMILTFVCVCVCVG